MKQKQLTEQEVRTKLIERVMIEYKDARLGLREYALKYVDAIGTEKVVWGCTSFGSFWTGWPYRHDTWRHDERINSWYYQLLNIGREEHEFNSTNDCIVCGTKKDVLVEHCRTLAKGVMLLCRGYR